MFDYTVCKNNSTDEFKKACKKIKEAFPNATVQKLLIDVDGSIIQTFTQDGKDIDVYNDYEVGAVYVKSEIELKIFDKITLCRIRLLY